MMTLATAAQMRELDRVAIEERGIPSLELMENAAAAAADILSASSGQDENSVALDPLFADPAASDYRPTNPRIRGFENFPREFGVRYGPLRAMADTPVLPTVEQKKAAPESRRLTVCQMRVKNIETDGEMSVYGTAGHNGALILAVEAGSEAEGKGLAAGDVIVAWGGENIRSMEDLAGRTLDADTPVAVLRKQKRTVL